MYRSHWWESVLKAIFLLPRRADLTHEQFMRRCTTQVELICKVPGVRKHAWFEAIAAPDGHPPYDAVVELWFDDLDDVRTAITSDAARAAEESLVDFVDFPAYKVFLTSERE